MIKGLNKLCNIFAIIFSMVALFMMGYYSNPYRDWLLGKTTVDTSMDYLAIWGITIVAMFTLLGYILKELQE